MSLEEALSKLTTVIEKQNELTERLLSAASAVKSAEPVTETKTKTTKATETKAAETKTEEPAGPTYEEVNKKANAWVVETGKGSPEQVARSAYFKDVLAPKLGVEKLKDLEGKPDEIAKFNTWLDTKSKTDLLGFGPGIFAKPAAAADGGEEL